RLHVRLDELHGVVDGEAGVDVAARRVDVDRDVLVRILRLEMEKLRHDQVRDLVVDGRAEEDDPLVEQARVDVERALAARGLLDHHRNHMVLDHAGSLLPGVHNFVSASVFSLSGVQSFSRASATSGAIGFTSAARRSSAARRRRSSRIDSCWPCAHTSSTSASASSPACSASSRRYALTSSSETSIPARSASASSASSRAMETAASSTIWRCSCSELPPLACR